VRSGASGSGNGSVTVSIAGNSGGARSATITIANVTVTVEQAAPAPQPCTYRLDDPVRSVNGDAQDITVAMNAASRCAWTVTSDVPWITVADAGPGSGNGNFRLTVAVNRGDARTGTVHAASETLTIRQAAGACTYAIKPTYYNAGRGPDSVNVDVSAGAGCPWTARSDAAWVTVAAGSSGSGNGTVRLTLQANNAAARSTTVTIAGQPLTVNQEGSCSYSLKPTFYHAGRGPDDVTVEVTTDEGCAWTAGSSVDWVTVREGASGTGKGKVRLAITANDGAPRQAVITIAGQPFDLRQDGRD